MTRWLLVLLVIALLAQVPWATAMQALILAASCCEFEDLGGLQ